MSKASGSTGHGHLNHYENTPIQYNDTFYGCKNEMFWMKKKVIFLLCLLEIEIVGTR